MKSYLFPASLAVAGLAMVIGAGSDKKQDLHQLPAVPTSRFVSQDGSAHETNTSSALPAISTNSAPRPLLVQHVQPTRSQTHKIFDAPYEFYHSELLRLDRCLQTRRQTQSCPFPDNDPKEFEVKVHSAALTTLKSLTEWQKRHHLQDDRITDLMADYLSFENAYVKQEALRLLATQPPQQDLLEPILTDVIEYPQPDSIAAGMKELSRYRGSKVKKKIDDTFERVLRNGAVNSAEEVAKNLGPFLTKENWLRYDKIRDDMARSPLSEDIFIALSQSLDK